MPFWRHHHSFSQGSSTPHILFSAGRAQILRSLLPSSAFNGRGFVLNVEGAPWIILRKDLTTLAQTWSMLSYSNLAPTSHTSDLNMDRARLVYGLVMNMDMDMGFLISHPISQMA